MNLGKFLNALRQIGTILTLLSELVQRLEEEKSRSNLERNEPYSDGTDKLL